ncbi:MAG: dihydrofolate reductase [Clostridium sp.]|nr:dihydrofolate reductase [Clostridium sp.]
MQLIVAVDENWAIGNKNNLLVSIPEDHKFFRQITMGHVVVLGRKTLAGFPGGLPLKGRTNIILTHDLDFEAKDAIIVHSKEELLETLTDYDSDDIFVIGGESVYNMMYPYCETAHVTKIHYSYEADKYFPNLDEMDNWVITGESDEQTYFDLEYYFYRYENRNPRAIEA